MTKSLTPEQTTQYYKAEGTKKKPLSPLDWLGQQKSTSEIPGVNIGAKIGANLGDAGQMIKPPASNALQEEITGAEKPDDLTTRLTEGIESARGATTLREEKATLETERGVEEQRDIVGSFEEEIAKTQTLLDELDDDITKRTREFLVSDPQRRRISAYEQAPLIKQLGTLERGLGTSESRLARTESDILTELGLIEKEKTEPLELLEREVKIRSQIKDLVDKELPSVVTSQFDEDGDLTIVTQDPTTGKFIPQTIKGIGEKANQYQSFQTSTDDAGNLTIIGIKKDGTVERLGGFTGVGKGTAGDAPSGEDLTFSQQIQAKKFIVDNFGKRALSDDALVSSVYQAFAEGKNLDEISDELRMFAQSEEFTGPVRDATESIGLGMSSDKRESFMNSVDRSLEEGNIQRVKEALVRGVTESLGTTEATKLRGDMRAVELFDEIENDLAEYERAGGDTNIFKGTAQRVTEKVGEVGDPTLAALANKIRMAVQTYRKAVSGAAFTESEAKEYQAVFPSTDKTSELNLAKIQSAREVLNGNAEFTLGAIMGKTTYDQIFNQNVLEAAGGGGSADGLSDEDAYQEYLNIINQ